ncbi:MAG: epoxyqueuosine reductase [Kiritimatiellae bacterium]|nr:epoxyqueuosine reductase [Kiritimatiellia bacterium]
MMAFRGELEKVAAGLGVKAFGVADLDEIKKSIPDLLDRVPGDYSRAVVMGVRLQDSVLDEIVDEPTILYVHNYRQANYMLDRAASVIADMIQDRGHRVVAIAASQIVSKRPMRAHISHRLLGQAAGLGFIGRSGLLVHPKYGARMRYVSILTDMPLDVDQPYKGDCGDCRACVALCPAKAIGESSKDLNLDACYKALADFTGISFVGQHICGVCVKACVGDRSLKALSVERDMSNR